MTERGKHPTIVCGDIAVRSGELDEPTTEGQRLVRALRPGLVWLTHEHRPWRPPHVDRTGDTDRVRRA